MPNKVEKIVEALLAKLEEGGVAGVHAWFVGRPNIIAKQEAGGYRVLMWREGVALEIEVDEEGNVKDVYLASCPR